jgi:hypothetical protein
MAEEFLPFTEVDNGNFKLRTFLENVDDAELKWHQDLEDRLVSPLHETDWMVQLDNEFPRKLVIGEEILIPKYVWHRLIKGSGDLEVKIVFK